MTDLLIIAIATPFAAGCLCWLIPERVRYLREAISLVTTGLLIGYVGGMAGMRWSDRWFSVDTLGWFVALGIAFFAFITAVYSVAYMRDYRCRRAYDALVLWTASAGIAAALSNHLILFISFWGFLGLTLYLLVSLGGSRAAAGAKKTFIIVGGSDAFLLLGIAILWTLTGSFTMSDMQISISGGIQAAAFLCLLCAALAKAGAMPVHTWIPEIAETAPVPVTAFLPASVDKLLGIYLLARICLDLFAFHQGLWLLVRLIGAVTIVAAVMMALVQHEMKKLLSYHAVSQVGYMVLGISTGNPIGIAGGLFHMANHAVYKCALFLGAGAVEKATGTTDLDRLGGLGRRMPVTFFCFLLASLAISGVPPLNGFFSKWMVYQGLFLAAQDKDPSWAVWLVAAMIGSGLTLASFIKILHSVFLGHPRQDDTAREVSGWMLAPSLILAGFCVAWGVGFLIPVQMFLGEVAGITEADLAFLLPPVALLLAALVLGALGLLFVASLRVRIVPSFVGGETPTAEMEMSGTGFYRTVEEEPLLSRLYAAARKKAFDLYEVLKATVFYAGAGLSASHTGILLAYISWILFGTVILLFLFVRV